MGRYGPLTSAEAMDVHKERLAGPEAARIDPRVVRRICMARRCQRSMSYV